MSQADRALLCRGIEPASSPSIRHVTSCIEPLGEGACGVSITAVRRGRRLPSAFGLGVRFGVRVWVWGL
jgi:hypothetical protein